MTSRTRSGKQQAEEDELGPLVQRQRRRVVAQRQQVVLTHRSRRQAGRADAVVAYMVSQGIDPARLSSRAVGENDLLTLNDDAAALALNKRTEFVLTGLLNA